MTLLEFVVYLNVKFVEPKHGGTRVESIYDFTEERVFSYLRKIL